MNLNSNKPAQTKFILGMWTALCVVTSMAVSLALWGMQFAQSSAMNDGMKVQSVLLTGGSDEDIH